jgi:hypothetical protein
LTHLGADEAGRSGDEDFIDIMWFFYFQRIYMILELFHGYRYTLVSRVAKY